MTLPLRKFDTQGVLALRDSLVFTLFMQKSHADLVPSVDKVFAAYLAFAGKDAAKWIHGAEDYQALTARRMTSARKQLSATPAKREYSLIVVGGSGSESDAPDFKFDYEGVDLETLARDYDSPDENSYLELWYPTELLAGVGRDKFVQHVLAIADEVAFASGYCSIALHYDAWAALAAEPIARPLALRHPGLALSDASNTALELGEDIRGAFWLTLLGTRQLERLQLDADTLANKLGPDITVHRLAHGVALQAGPEPELGDVNKGQRLPLVRRVAELTEPLLYTPTMALFGFEMDAFQDYERRHLP